ncbi:PTS fructose transporter subunit IIC [Gilliamella apicola]|uniref:PTS fructose transporter subunit IIC n=1 Tax=Gilliamella apicola TaxID=1196095 RepID=A0A2V4E315_9GAMM|nr:PTS fructose transporter subunit IIC [Gilliamella apicola]
MDTKNILAVINYSTNVTDNFMAEDALKSAALKEGLVIKIETNGVKGIENQITDADIAYAIGVIIISDKRVNPTRFNGLPIIEVSIKDAIYEAALLIEKINSGNVPVYKNSESNIYKLDNLNQREVKEPWQMYKHLTSGVYYMLPFTVAGGLLISLSLLCGIYSSDPNNAEYNEFAALLIKIGSQSIQLMLPIFTSFLAYSISGRYGMIVGFVGGSIVSLNGTGILGCISVGFTAGYLMLFLDKLLSNLPRSFEGIKSILIMPLIGIFIIGVSAYLSSRRIATISTSMAEWLFSLQSSNPILLGIIIGTMCSFDIGGLINKAAYATSIMLLEEGNYYFIASVSAACIVPPLVIAFSTTIFRGKAFTKEERAAGIANYILGSTLITEGALPFVAKDPFRVIPIMMFSSTIAAVLTFICQIQVPAPQGGFLVLPLVNKPFIWVGCIFISALVGAILLGLIRTHETPKQH